jgi:hypothetical protein
MGTTDIGPFPNSEDFKAQQFQIWTMLQRVGQDWWQAMERGAQNVSDKIVQLAEIKPVDSVLDIATGIVEPAVTAARKVLPCVSFLILMAE